MWSQALWAAATHPKFLKLSAKAAQKVAEKNATIIDADDLHQEAIIAAAEGHFGDIPSRVGQPGLLYEEIRRFMLRAIQTEISRSSKHISYERLVEEATS